MRRSSLKVVQIRCFKSGSTSDLMPSIMGAIDAIWENNKVTSDLEDNDKTLPKRSLQASNFSNLSPNVQKILANVADEDLNKNFSASEESLSFKKFNSSDPGRRSYRTLRSTSEKPLNKSTENLEISSSVQKMLSNLPDIELVNKNCSFLQNKNNKNELKGSKSFCGTRTSFLHSNKIFQGVPELTESCSVSDNLSTIDTSNCITCKSNGIVQLEESLEDTFSQKPLGSYLHTSPSGITSRTPVGRKNIGKYLQVPSESSVGTSSTASSEVSRPVSLTSLGSCSSSSSGGPHQPGSAYLASAESLDSDPEPTGSQGSADSGIADQPTMSPEQCVLQEVMDTETVYVSDLREVIQGYLDPWRSNPECLLLEHLDDLFSNLEQIYLFNRSFLEELQEANYDPTLTANAFIHHDAGFSVYTEYCTHYPRTMTVLCELTRNENVALLFRERQKALGHALPLGSYLLKPVQRILKYHLLLQRLSKQCEPSHQSAVDLALATMTSVASHINTMKGKHEHAVRVQEIQSQLYGWTGPDLTALGELIAEGTFRISGARGRRHVFLFDKVLLIAKSKQDGCLCYKSHIMCSNLMLVEQVRGELLSFHILPFDNPRQQCTLRARSLQHKREWTLQLKRVILENYNAVIPSHARQLVLQLGQTTEEEELHEKWSPLKQHSTPQYLERRSRFRKTGDFSNRRAASQDRSFVSLSNWRRKSEPGFINHYTSKTLPKRISKIKKNKEYQPAKFYTDLSDSENCDINQSNDCLTETLDNKCDSIQESNNESDIASTTLEKVVSDLLMQNEEFHKLLSRQRRNIRGSEPCTWTETVCEELPAKADSLPRDFQLNDKLDVKDVKPITRDDSLLSIKQSDIEDIQESDLSSQLHLNSNDHPDHKIYRKSAIRFSLVQRFRAIISEEQKQHGKYLTHKQGSKSMGAKIANPDYADPQKLFLRSQSDVSVNKIQTNLNVRISEEEVVDNKECNELNSSQNSEGYYERLMEQNLNDVNDHNKQRKVIKRPTKAPPPIPVKPTRLNHYSKENIENSNFHTGRRKIFVSKSLYEVSNDNNDQTNLNSIDQSMNQKGWVKTIVGRFE